MSNKIVLLEVLVVCLALLVFSSVKIVEMRRNRILPSDEEIIEKYKHRYRSIEEKDVTAAIRLLRHPNPDVRREAITIISVAFREHSPSAEKALPNLIEISRTDPDPWLRSYAAGRLARRGNKEGLGPLMEIGSDSTLDEMTRAMALRSLRLADPQVRIDGEKVAEIALALFYSRDDEVRIQALYALPFTNDTTKMRLFLKFFVDHVVHPDSSLMARRSMGTGGGNRYGDFLFAYQLGLSSFASKAPDIVYELLNHPNEKVKWYAAKALAHHRDENGVGALIDLLRTSKDWEVRRDVIADLAYGPAADTTLIPLLKKALKDPYVHEPWSTSRHACRPVAERAYGALISRFHVPREELGEDPTLGHTHLPLMRQ